MSQSRALSAVEALTNVAVGYGLAVLAQVAVFPVFGIAVTASQALEIGAVFTGLSLARSYVLRRLFDRWGIGLMPQAPLSLGPDQVREVETLAALLSQDQIADYFGICRNTFRAIRARDPEVDARYKRGKAKAIAHVANGLLQKARAGCKTSSIFYLKTQGGWRETERIEHSGPEGGPVETTGAVEQLRALVETVAERNRAIPHTSRTGATESPRALIAAQVRADPDAG